MAERLSHVQRKLIEAREAKARAAKLEQEALQQTYLTLGKLVYDAGYGDLSEVDLLARLRPPQDQVSPHKIAPRRAALTPDNPVEPSVTVNGETKE